MDKIENILDKLDKVFPYMDENTYLACKEILEEGLELGNIVKEHQKWDLKIEAKCSRLLYRSLIEKNLQEASNLVSNDISEMKNGIDIVIDGDSLFDRLIFYRLIRISCINNFRLLNFRKFLSVAL